MAYQPIQNPMPVSQYDSETGQSSIITGLRDVLVAQRTTVLSDSLADGIATFWTQTTATGGTITSTVGEGQLKTSTGATGSAQMVSTTVPYYPGQVAWMNSAVRFGDTGVAGNIRRIGMFTVSGTTPQEGFYYELNGTTLNAVYVKAGSATAVASTSWTKFATAPFTLDANYHSFEIRYTANSIWFYIDNVLRHNVSGTSVALTTSLTLPITITNVKTSGATDITFAVRNIGNGRFGESATVVNETGLSAVNARAIGGATPHDSVDSGNPVKIGGVALNAFSTAVANGDRVNSTYDIRGRNIVAFQPRELVIVQTTAVSVTTADQIILAAEAGTFRDISSLIITNSTSTACTVTLKDAVGGTTRAVYNIAANGGLVSTFNIPIPQAVANTAWCVTQSAAITLNYNVVAIKN